MKIKQQNRMHKNSLAPFLIVALLVVQTGVIAKTWSDNRSVNKNLSSIGLSQAGGVFDESQPVVDAALKRLYLPGLNLYLPLNLDTLDLNYRVTDARGGGTIDILFLSKINNSVSVNNSISNECMDLVRVEIGATRAQPRPNESVQKPFRLDDGRMVYSYLPATTSRCQDSLPVTPEQIEPAVQQLHSY